MSFFRKNNDHSHIKDRQLETRISNRRIVFSLFFVIVLLLILIARFYTLQVQQYEHFVTRSDRNRIQVQPVAPTRGLIYDRKGRLLADNSPSYSLSIVRERVRDLDKTLSAIDALIGLTDADRNRFLKALKRRRRPYEAVPLRFKLSDDEISRIAVNEYHLDGVEISAQLVRSYPYGALFAHSVGYVGRVSERELNAFDAEQVRRYSGTFSIGKVGLEKFYEDALLGEVGSQKIEKNAHSRTLRLLERRDPEPGKNLQLFLDVDMQKVATQALEGRRGSIVAIDVKTGGILAMVSEPSYDPNLFVTGISYKAYEALNTSIDIPLFNRAIQGQYPPGSTLKPILGLAGMETGFVTKQTTIFDPGYYQLENDERLYRDWKKTGHGHRVDLEQAIVESCDTFFYDLAFRMGIDNMHPYGEQFGLGTRTKIDLPNERPGLWPSRLWKKGAKGLPWFPGDSLNVTIGQGFVLATPLQLAVMTATIASKGEMKRPRLVKSIDGVEQDLEILNYLPADYDHWRHIIDSMVGVVHGRRGTARSIGRGLTYEIAGKTGTAQVVGIAQDAEYDSEKIAERNRDHSLFIAFAPAKSPQIALAIILENGEHGAAPLSTAIFDAWLERDDEGDNASVLIHHGINNNETLSALGNEHE